MARRSNVCCQDVEGVHSKELRDIILVLFGGCFCGGKFGIVIINEKNFDYHQLF